MWTLACINKYAGFLLLIWIYILNTLFFFTQNRQLIKFSTKVMIISCYLLTWQFIKQASVILFCLSFLPLLSFFVSFLLSFFFSFFLSMRYLMHLWIHKLNNSGRISFILSLNYIQIVECYQHNWCRMPSLLYKVFYNLNAPSNSMFTSCMSGPPGLHQVAHPLLHQATGQPC